MPTEIKFDKDGKPIIKGDKIKDLPPHLQALIKQQQQLLKRKKDGGIIKFKNGNLIDVSRGQAGYEFKGIF